MIKKISKLNNIFCYSIFEWDNINSFTFNNKGGTTEVRDGHFSKNNILFAENGNGKSKLVSILKSLSGEQQEIEKHRDRASDDQEIEILFDDESSISFDGDSWSRDILKNKFIVFDKYFTEKFVHSTGIEVGDTPFRQ